MIILRTGSRPDLSVSQPPPRPPAHWTSRRPVIGMTGPPLLGDDTARMQTLLAIGRAAYHARAERQKRCSAVRTQRIWPNRWAMFEPTVRDRRRRLTETLPSTSGRIHGHGQTARSCGW